VTAPLGIDFARLTLRDGLDLAISIEEEARDRYRDFAEQLTLHHTAEAANFFSRMARVEEIHRLRLDERRQALFPGEASSAIRAKVFDVEAPEFDAVRVFMSVEQALQTALAAEVKAYDFFARAIPQLENVEVRALFKELRDEEVEHQTLVKQEMDRISGEPSANGEAYADDPVPQ
jgi:erythrin-vacuolar iron transport family protein